MPSINPSSSIPIVVNPLEVSVYEVDNYKRYIVGGPHVRVYEGSRIAMVVADGLEADFSPNITDKKSNDAMRKILLNLQALLTVYDTMVGMVPPPTYNSQIHGKVPYEIGYLVGAGGRAGHGVAGVAIGPALMGEMYRWALAGDATTINHVFYYEIMRNYMFPEIFTLVLDYSMNGGPLDWGWVNQGFIDVTGCLVSEIIDPPVSFNYYGNNREAFMDMMEAHVFTYMSNTSYNWDNTFMHNRLAWSPSQSVDNLFAGILVNLYRNELGFQFIRGFFHALPGLVPRAPKSKLDNQGARDNFFLAASIGAKRNLYDLFTKDLRWNISTNAKDYLVTNYQNIADTPGHRIMRPVRPPSKTPTISVSMKPTVKPSSQSTISPSSRPEPRIFITPQEYSMNLGGIAGADAICTSLVGRSAQALLSDETGCSGGPCRRATSPKIAWPLQPNTVYYNADYSAIVATTDSNAMLPTQLTNPITVQSRCINQALGMNSDWITTTGLTCNNWNSTASTDKASVGWLCPTGLSTHDLLSGGTKNCNYPMQFLCVVPMV